MNQQNANMTNSGTATLGSHPVGVGLGAVGVGAAAGAAGGAIAGPVGAVAGAAVGAVVGGMAGGAAAQALDPNVESKFWRETHPSKPYANSGYGYDEYAPAYRYGWESFGQHGTQGKTFEHVEQDLAHGWDQAKGTSRLTWDKAKEATREAWNRVKLAMHCGQKTEPVASHRY